jgi:hypothetical protein
MAMGCAAMVATVADAALLQRDRSYFTGGFLAVDTVQTASQAAGFVFGSLVADAGMLGLVAAVVLWLGDRLRLSPRLAVVCAVGAALVPVAVTDFTEYQLATYLGDAFDLRLMFDLAGRDAREFIAVGWAQLLWIVLAAAVMVAVAAWLFAVVFRRARVPQAHVTRVGWVAACAPPVVLLLCAMTVTTAIRRGSDVLDNGLRRKPTGQWLGAIVEQLSDVDRDGYGLLGRPPDPALFDGRVRPYALDRPGDGVDADGVAGDLPAGAAPYQEGPGAPPVFARRPDVVLVVLESFRADAVGAQLHGRAVTPVIDDLARRGVSSQAAYSHNGYTVQARHHIFSGSVADVRGGTTLIDDFNANGYETAYFSGQDESFGGTAYDVGFKRAHVAYDARDDRDRRYSTFSTAGSLAVPNAVLLERVTSFLAGRDGTKPLFLYVNFHDTHFPYHHRGIDPLINATPLPQADISPDRRDALRATYLNTAANVDRAIGRLLQAVRQHRQQDPAVVIVADHGESLFDEGFLGHGYALNDAQTRIPLVIANLDVTLTEPVGQSDLRDALREALVRSGGGTAPSIRRDPARHVFQYLGTIARPAEIAFTTLDGRFRYDFRDSRAQADMGNWVRPDSLGPSDANRWRELVTTWERMMIARAQLRKPAS